MKIKEAKLETMATRISQYPENDLEEFVIIGRSNVGKSTFINTVSGKNKLAYTSSIPGKTQTINFYLMDDKFYLVDVPGYGYAKTNYENRMKFGLMVEEYLTKRSNLKRVFLLIDSHIKAMEDDLLMYDFLKYHHIPTVIVFTKVDKIPKTKREKTLNNLSKSFDVVLGDEIILFSKDEPKLKDGVLQILERNLGVTE